MLCIRPGTSYVSNEQKMKKAQTLRKIFCLIKNSIFPKLQKSGKSSSNFSINIYLPQLDSLLNNVDASPSKFCASLSLSIYLSIYLFIPLSFLFSLPFSFSFSFYLPLSFSYSIFLSLSIFPFFLNANIFSNANRV